MEEKRTNMPAKRTAVAKRANSARPVMRRNTAELHNIHIETKKKTHDEKKPFPVSVVVMSVCFTVLFLFMMINYISLEKLNKELYSQETVIEDLKIEKSKLEEKLEKRDTPEEIREYAENELGMVKETETDAPQYYIDLKKEDKIEMTKHEDEAENGLGTLLTGIGGVIGSFFGN